MSIDNEMLQAIAAELTAMSEADQAMRKSDMWDKSVDERNTTRMHEIVAQIGWPTVSKVGTDASHLAWLLVQHADLDRNFQRTCLALMQAQPEGEVKRQDIAYLEDRVCIGEHRLQLYGTQFFHNPQGDLEPLPMLDPDQVDERRAAVGLAPLAEYATRMQAHRKSG